MSTPRLRIFVAHPSNFDAELPQYLEALKTLVLPQFPHATFVTGVDDHAQRFVMDGGWDGWCQSVASGKEYAGYDLVPRFNAIVVGPRERIGKATAAIVREAKKAGKGVFFFDGAQRFVQVLGVNTLDDQNYQEGWEVIPG